MSACNKVVMKFPFSTDSYDNEPDEWISSFAADDYNDSRIKLGLSLHYPDLHICKENKASGLSLYKMNEMIQNGDDYDVYSYNKVLEFFIRDVNVYLKVLRNNYHHLTLMSFTMRKIHRLWL